MKSSKLIKFSNFSWMYWTVSSQRRLNRRNMRGQNWRWKLVWAWELFRSVSKKSKNYSIVERVISFRDYLKVGKIEVRSSSKFNSLNLTLILKTCWNTVLFRDALKIFRSGSKTAAPKKDASSICAIIYVISNREVSSHHLYSLTILEEVIV